MKYGFEEKEKKKNMIFGGRKHELPQWLKRSKASNKQQSKHRFNKIMRII